MNTRHTPTVLVVEDHDDDILFIRSLLETAGFDEASIVCAETLDEAVSLLASHEFSFALIDYALHRKEYGTDLLPVISRLQPGVDILFCSGRDDFETEIFPEIQQQYGELSMWHMHKNDLSIASFNRELSTIGILPA